MFSKLIVDIERENEEFTKINEKIFFDVKTLEKIIATNKLGRTSSGGAH